MEPDCSGRSRPPFAEGFDAGRVYVGGSFAEALARLRFLADGRRSGGLVIAPAGMGKTTLLSLAARRWRTSGRLAARAACGPAGFEGILESLLRGLGAPPATADANRLLARLIERLQECRHQEIEPIILIDAAERLDPPCGLDRLLRTLEHEVHPNHRPTIVLAARPEFLGSAAGRSAADLELRIPLRPLSWGETAEYLARQLEAAGAEPDRFEPAAVERLHHLTGGVLGHIQHLARLSLVAASAREAGRVSARLVERVFFELSPRSLASSWGSSLVGEN